MTLWWSSYLSLILFRIWIVSSGEVASTITIWKRRAKAPSFSMYCLYSSKVVAPMHWISPRARAGLNMLDASREPEAPPAPTIVCNSSMNRMTLGDFSNSFITAFIRSSNCPLYLVPATKDARSKVTTRLLNKIRETFFWTMRKANPSAMAVLPTPGSPIKIGLFFFLRERICATRSISFSRPMIGSSLSSSAILVRSRPKLSKTGVRDFSAPGLLDPPPEEEEPNNLEPSSSPSSASARALGEELLSDCISSISLMLS